MKYPVIFFYALELKDKALTDDEVRFFLNARSDVSQWIQLAENVYAIESMVEAASLAKIFRAYMVKNGHSDEPAKQHRHAFFDFDPASGWGVLYKGAWVTLRGMKEGEEEEIPF